MEDAYLNGFSGLLNAPTGSGKTFALFLPFLAVFINKHPENYLNQTNNGLLMLWITPLRALTNDIKKAMQEVCDEIGLPWKIATRTGDTPAAEKQALKKKLPEVLLTTPEKPPPDDGPKGISKAIYQSTGDSDRRMARATGHQNAAYRWSWAYPG